MPGVKSRPTAPEPRTSMFLTTLITAATYLSQEAVSSASSAVSSSSTEALASSTAETLNAIMNETTGMLEYEMYHFVLPTAMKVILPCAIVFIVIEVVLHVIKRLLKMLK